jgi:hypothetical protein
MGEKVSIKEATEHNSLIGYCLMQAMGKASTANKVMETIRPGDEHIEVVLTINGVEVSLRGFLEQYNSQTEEWVHRQARRLFEDRLRAFEETLERGRKALSSFFRQQFPDDHWEEHE